MEKKNDNQFEVVFCIVNAGFSEKVMDEARKVGATGGTVLSASGTANQEAEKKFGIVISPEKEIVMIVVDKKIKDDVLHSLYRQVGLDTAGYGIAFSMPISDVVGIRPYTQEKEDAKSDKKSAEKSTEKI